jgi:hypothetical protein
MTPKFQLLVSADGRIGANFAKDDREKSIADELARVHGDRVIREIKLSDLPPLAKSVSKRRMD